MEQILCRRRGTGPDAFCIRGVGDSGRHVGVKKMVEKTLISFSIEKYFSFTILVSRHTHLGLRAKGASCYSLERPGYHVTVYTDSNDALNAFGSAPGSFDLVISDMTMPGMTGDQLAGKVLSIRPDIPFIICTGFSEGINAEKAERSGIKGFLMKPITKNEMARMVRDLLDRSKGPAGRGGDR